MSIHPHHKDQISKNMLSWFPLFFPFKVRNWVYRLSFICYRISVKDLYRSPSIYPATLNFKFRYGGSLTTNRCGTSGMLNRSLPSQSRLGRAMSSRWDNLSNIPRPSPRLSAHPALYSTGENLRLLISPRSLLSIRYMQLAVSYMKLSKSAIRACTTRADGVVGSDCEASM